jgi:hypothetical protein
LELGYDSIYDPQPDNKSHALMAGDTNRIAKKLSFAAKQVFAD